jgi:hypothetical protein
LGTCAFPTAIGHFVPLAAGTTPTFSESLTYDYNIGKRALSKDINGQQTAYSYSEPGNLDRLTTVTRPDGSTTVFTYIDTPLSVQTEAATDQISIGDGIVKSFVSYDGLGRVSQEWTSAPEANTLTSTYDYKGRPYTVSNPGSSCVTTTTYDGLDRVTNVKACDGSLTNYTYTPDTTTLFMATQSVDPMGMSKVSYSDGLGRLVRVDENGASVPAVSGAGCGMNTSRRYRRWRIQSNLDRCRTLSEITERKTPEPRSLISVDFWISLSNGCPK